MATIGEGRDGGSPAACMLCCTGQCTFHAPTGGPGRHRDQTSTRRERIATALYAKFIPSNRSTNAVEEAMRAVELADVLIAELERK